MLMIKVIKEQRIDIASETIIVRAASSKKDKYIAINISDPVEADRFFKFLQNVVNMINEVGRDEFINN